MLALAETRWVVLGKHAGWQHYAGGFYASTSITYVWHLILKSQIRLLLVGFSGASNRFLTCGTRTRRWSVSKGVTTCEGMIAVRSSQ